MTHCWVCEERLPPEPTLEWYSLGDTSASTVVMDVFNNQLYVEVCWDCAPGIRKRLAEHNRGLRAMRAKLLESVTWEVEREATCRNCGCWYDLGGRKASAYYCVDCTVAWKTYRREARIAGLLRLKFADRVEWSAGR